MLAEIIIAAMGHVTCDMQKNSAMAKFGLNVGLDTEAYTGNYDRCWSCYQQEILYIVY